MAASDSRPEAATALPGPKISAWPPPKTQSLRELRLPAACPTCGAPGGEPGFLRYDAPVGHPNFGKICPCPDCHSPKQRAAGRSPSQLEGRLALATFENYRPGQGNKAAFQAVSAFARRPRAWLTLWGSYGLGKSHLLAAAVNSCLARGLTAAYYTLPDLLDRLRAGYDGGDYSPLLERLRAIDLLALDEVDKVHLTSWAGEKIYQLADARYRRLAESGTLFALNVDPRAGLDSGSYLQLQYLFSRMLDGHSQVIQLAGDDARPLAPRLWQE